MKDIQVSKLGTITSREFAKLSDREHKNIVTAIKTLNVHLVEMSKARLASQNYTSRGKEFVEYIMTKDQAELLAMKMDTKVMIKVKDKFNEMREVLQKPQTYDEVMQGALLLADQKVKELQNQLEENKPLVNFAKTVGDSSDGILIRDFSKVIYDTGINMGQNKLFKWFRDQGYLMKTNLPYQHFMQYFEVIERPIQTIMGTKINTTTYINGRGQIYFLEKLKKHQEGLS